MFKKVVTYTALVCLLASMPVGCYSKREVSMKHLLAFSDHEGFSIRRVVTNDGEVFEFARDLSPAWDPETTVIIGIPVKRSSPDDTHDPPKMVRIRKEERETVYVQVSDVRILYLEKINSVATTSVVVAVTLTLLIIAAAQSAAQSCSDIELSSSDQIEPTSCPYVYSYDGEYFVCEGVPYIGSMCEVLERTDMLRLEQLVPVDNEYRIRVANEAAETEFIDEVHLVVADHAPGLEFVSDSRGVIHSIAGRQPPLTVTDQHGYDWRRWLAEKDFLYWEGEPRNMNPGSASGLRDTLLFTFDRPSSATRAKLLVSGGHSGWAIGLERALLDLWGADVDALYEGLRDPDTRARFLAWVQREEMADLAVRVRTADGWRVADRVSFRGSEYAGECAAVVDLGSVEGEVLEVALTPPAGVWRVNAVTADFSPDAAVTVQEVVATSAVGSAGEDFTALLQANDDDYLVQPRSGMAAQLVFQNPELQPGSARTVFVKASGYYDIHLDAEGPANAEAIARLENEPGYAAVFALRKHPELEGPLSLVGR
jgi:hypothetical protein